MTPHKISRIGVFDSGRGGEIMTQYLREHLPQLEFVFKDDQEHAPYGEKSPSEIFELGTNMVNKLVAEQVEAVVVACHTISSTCFSEVQAASPIPLISVNEALISEIATLPMPLHIGVLATRATVNTDWFPPHIKALNPDNQISSVACPQLATAIDARNETWIDQLLDEYLAQLSLDSIEAIALACTHYPVVTEQIRAKLPRQIPILDAQRKVAEMISQF